MLWVCFLKCAILQMRFALLYFRKSAYLVEIRVGDCWHLSADLRVSEHISAFYKIEGASQPLVSEQRVVAGRWEGWVGGTQDPSDGFQLSSVEVEEPGCHLKTGKQSCQGKVLDQHFLIQLLCVLPLIVLAYSGRTRRRHLPLPVPGLARCLLILTSF